MRTLDRYIIRQFLINFAILLLVFLCLFVLIDLIVDLDEFVEAGRERATRTGNLFTGILVTVGDYYGPVSLMLYVFFSGLIAAAAMGFTLTSLGRSGELVAMATSGISMGRAAMPVIVAGCLLNVLTLPCQELLIPQFAHKLARSKNHLQYDTAPQLQVHYAIDRRRSLLSAAEFDPYRDQAMLKGVTILTRDERGMVQRRITAEQAFWDAGRGGWELIGGYAISAKPPEDPFAGPGTRGVEPEEFYQTTLTPSVLLSRRATNYPVLLSSVQLRELSQNLAPEDGPIRKIMHSRFSLMVVNMLVLVIGLPFFLVTDSGNPLRDGAKAAGVCIGAWGFGLVLLQVTATQFNPVMAAWLPVVILLPASAALLQTIRS